MPPLGQAAADHHLRAAMRRDPQEKVKRPPPLAEDHGPGFHRRRFMVGQEFDPMLGQTAFQRGTPRRAQNREGHRLRGEHREPGTDPTGLEEIF
ncbi:MAG: hypothetical protein ACK4OK_04220 [Thermoflexus sp.]